MAQLLQQTRTQLQASSSAGTSAGQALLQAGAPALLGEPEALDELLFLTYLQAQYSSGGWAEGVGLFRQLQQVRLTIYSRFASQQGLQVMSACAGLVDTAICLWIRCKPAYPASCVLHDGCTATRMPHCALRRLPPNAGACC